MTTEEAGDRGIAAQSPDADHARRGHFSPASYWLYE